MERDGDSVSAAQVTPGRAWLDRAAYPFEHRYLEIAGGRMRYGGEDTGTPVIALEIVLPPHAVATLTVELAPS